MLTRPTKAVSFLASDERVTSLGQSSSLMAVWPKSDSSWADLAGCRAIALTVTPLTLCHRIDLPTATAPLQRLTRFQIASRDSDISSVGPMTAHLGSLAERVLAKLVKHSVLRGDRI